MSRSLLKLTVFDLYKQQKREKQAPLWCFIYTFIFHKNKLLVPVMCCRGILNQQNKCTCKPSSLYKAILWERFLADIILCNKQITIVLISPTRSTEMLSNHFFFIKFELNFSSSNYMYNEMSLHFFKVTYVLVFYIKLFNYSNQRNHHIITAVCCTKCNLHTVTNVTLTDWRFTLSEEIWMGEANF